MLPHMTEHKLKLCKTQLMLEVETTCKMVFSHHKKFGLPTFSKTLVNIKDMHS